MSKRIKGITIELDGSTTGLDKALEGVTKKSNKLYGELQSVERALKFNPGNADLVAQKQKLLGDQVETTKERLNKLRAAQAEVDKQFAEGKINEEQYRAFQREIIETESKLKHFETQLASSQSKLKAFGESATAAGQKMKDAGAKITSAGKEMSTKVTAPIMGAAAAAVLVGANFEQSMSNVAAISGATGKDFQTLEAKAREMGATTNKSASEAADALSYMALAGWDTQQMVGGIEPVLKLSSAGNIDLARTSDLVTDSMAALQLQVKDLPNFLDMVAKASQKSNTDVDKLMEAFLVAGGSMSTFNVPLEEATSILGIMANRGYKGAEAGTALNAIFTNLTSQTGQAAKALKKWGISAFDSNEEFIGLEAVLMKVKEKTDGMTDAQKANFIAMVAGKEHLKTFNGILAGLGNEYGDLKGEVSNASGALQQMYDVMTDNLKGRWDEFTSALEEAGIAIFKNLQPALESLLGFLQSLANWFNELSPSMQNTIMIVAGLAAALGPLLVVVGLLVTSLGGIFTAIGTFSGALGVVAGGAAAATPAVGALASVFAFLTGPIGIAIAAITGIVAALVLAYTKIEWFRDGVQNVFGAIQTAVSTALEAVVGFISSKLSQIQSYWTENGELIRSATSNVWRAIQAVIETVMPIIEGVIKVAWTAIQFIVKSVWDNIKGVISGALDIVLGLVKTFAGLFTGDWQAMWDGIKQLFSGAIDLIWNGVQLMLWGRLLKGIAVFAGSFRTAATSLWSAVQGVFTGAITAVRNFFTNGFNAMQKVASTTMSGIRTVISNVWNTIKNVFSSVINTIKNTVTSGFSNVVNAIRTQMGNAVSAVKTKMGDMLGAIKGKAGDFLNAGKDLVRGLIKGINEMAAAAIESITGVVDGIVNKAKSMLKIASPSKLMEQIGIWTGEGLAGGIESTKAANEKAITGVTKVISAATKKNADEVAKIADAAEKKRTEIQNDFAKKRAELSRKTAQSSQSALKTHKNKKGEIVRTGEQKVLNIRADASAKLTKLNEDEQKKLAAVNEKAWADMQKQEAKVNKERLDAIKLYVQDKKTQEELSHYAESEIWRKSLAVFKEGTKERVEIQKNYQASLKSINDEVTKTNEEYAGKMQKINDDLRKQEDDLTQTYEKALVDRTNSIRGFAGLFDEISFKAEKTGEDLINNLRNQVSYIDGWAHHIEMIAKRGIDEGLLDELRAMGPKALPELVALNQLTDRQLSEYSELYRKKTELARQQAEKELVGMKADTEKRIVELRNTANRELESLRLEWMNKIQQVTRGTSAELGKMPTSLKSIGNDAIRGLMEGLKQMEGPLMKQAKSIADSVSDTMRKALQIKSPSRVMMEIGKFTGEGLADGIKKTIASVERASSLLAMATVPNVAGYGVNQVNGPSPERSSTTPVVHNYERMLEGAVFHVREESDIRKLAREIFLYQQQVARGRGI